MEWISVKDRLPEKGQVVVALRDIGEYLLAYTTVWDDEEERFMGPQFNNITHWCCLDRPEGVNVPMKVY